MYWTSPPSAFDKFRYGVNLKLGTCRYERKEIHERTCFLVIIVLKMSYCFMKHQTLMWILTFYQIMKSYLIFLFNNDNVFECRQDLLYILMRRNGYLYNWLCCVLMIFIRKYIWYLICTISNCYFLILLLVQYLLNLFRLAHTMLILSLLLSYACMFYVPEWIFYCVNKCNCLWWDYNNKILNLYLI